jgi:hypothetical protein
VKVGVIGAERLGKANARPPDGVQKYQQAQNLTLQDCVSFRLAIEKVMHSFHDPFALCRNDNRRAGRACGRIEEETTDAGE